MFLKRPARAFDWREFCGKDFCIKLCLLSKQIYFTLQWTTIQAQHCNIIKCTLNSRIHHSAYCYKLQITTYLIYPINFYCNPFWGTWVWMHRSTHRKNKELKVHCQKLQKFAFLWQIEFKYKQSLLLYFSAVSFQILNTLHLCT